MIKSIFTSATFMKAEPRKKKQKKDRVENKEKRIECFHSFLSFKFIRTVAAAI